MRRFAALGLVALCLVPSVLAHEGEDHDEDSEAPAADPMRVYRDLPWFSVVDDKYWIYGDARKIAPPAGLPEEPYASEWEFVADGAWIVWVDPTRPGGDVFAYNLDARAGLYLTDDAAEQHNPSVRGRYVAWEDYRDGQPEIWAYDLEGGAAAFRITNSTAAQINPAVGDGWIVWEDRRDRRNGTDLWIWSALTGTSRPLVTGLGDQTQATMAGDHVLFRDDHYGQGDIAAVRVANGSTPFWITRDVGVEVQPVSAGGSAFFLKNDPGGWALVHFDGLRNVTRSTGYVLDAAARVEVERGVAVYTTYHSGGRYFLTTLNLNNGRSARLTDSIPLQGGPRWADERVVVMTAEDPPQLLVIEPSRYGLATPPRMTLVGPPSEAPFTGPRFLANGTFRTSPAWGDPIRFEYRFGSGNWTAFDATRGAWNVTVEVPRGFQLGQKVRFEVRAVFADAPPAGDSAQLTYTRLMTIEPLRDVPPMPLAMKLKRALGAIILTAVAAVVVLLFAVRLVLRGTLRRLLQRRVQAEYLRPDPPFPPEPPPRRGR